MTPDDHIRALASAPDAASLEEAFQAAFEVIPRVRHHGGRLVHNGTYRRLEDALRSRGEALCDSHPHGHLVPRFRKPRTLTVCGESRKIGRAGNGAGHSYVWADAEAWTINLLRAAGLSRRAAHTVWSWWAQYPHRALQAVDDALAGCLPDPELNVLIPHPPLESRTPIRLTVAENNACAHDRRATRTCSCGKGTLFDWGGGYRHGLAFVEWRCNGCPSAFTEYMTHDQFTAMRQNPTVLHPASMEAGA